MIARILLVEDEFLIRLVLSEALADAGFEVIEAGDADEAEACIEGGGRFDMMITDIQMPGRLDGVGLGRKLRERRVDVPVIYTTGRPAAAAGLAQLGPREALAQKPCAPSEIVSIVHRLLAAESAPSGLPLQSDVRAKSYC